MSRYTVLVKLSARQENGNTIQAGTTVSINEGIRLGQQTAYQMGHRGRIYISILDMDRGGFPISTSDAFC